MTIRLIINIVRWSWGLPSYDFVGDMTENDLMFMMFFGAFIDALVIFGIVFLVKNIFENLRKKKGWK